MAKIYFLSFILLIKYIMNKKIKNNSSTKTSNDLYTFNYGTLNEIKIGDKEQKEL